MKKILAVVLMTVSASAFAWYPYRGPVYVYNNGGYHGGWVAPALAGAVVGAAIARPYYAPPVVYVQPSPTYIQQPYPAGYVQQTILDANCNCYRTVLVPQQ